MQTYCDGPRGLRKYLPLFRNSIAASTVPVPEIRKRITLMFKLFNFLFTRPFRAVPRILNGFCCIIKKSEMFQSFFSRDLDTLEN